jgi:hypothetical protein
MAPHLPTYATDVKTESGLSFFMIFSTLPSRVGSPPGQYSPRDTVGFTPAGLTEPRRWRSMKYAAFFLKRGGGFQVSQMRRIWK